MFDHCCHNIIIAVQGLSSRSKPQNLFLRPAVQCAASAAAEAYCPRLASPARALQQLCPVTCWLPVPVSVNLWVVWVRAAILIHINLKCDKLENSSWPNAQLLLLLLLHQTRHIGGESVQLNNLGGGNIWLHIRINLSSIANSQVNTGPQHIDNYIDTSVTSF